MVELSTFDSPPLATAVSGEQTLPRLDEFRQLPWLEPDWEEATRIALRVIERYWHKYVFPFIDIPCSSLKGRPCSSLQI